MPPAIPIATYRLQLTARLRLRRRRRARALSEGARHQPSLRLALPARRAPGSTHGYDIVDHNALNPELGGEEAFPAAARRARGRPISGSFSTSCRTTWACTSPTIPGGSTCWNGDRPRRTPHSFDIDWETLPGRPRGGVLLPILGRSYGEALERGEIELRYDAARRQLLRLVLRASAADRAQPLRRDPAEGRRGGRRATTSQRAAGCSPSPRAIAGRTIRRAATGAGLQGRACRDRGRQPRSSSAGSTPIGRAPAIREPCSPCTICSSASTTGSAHWRLAGSEINYRRFFDINALAGLRVEDCRHLRPRIHALVAPSDRARAACTGCGSTTSTGCAIPLQYFRRLQRLIAPQMRARRRAVLRRGRERFSPTASGCRDLPASPAPPATNGSTSSPACCSTTAASTRSTSSGARSSGERATFDEIAASTPSAACSRRCWRANSPCLRVCSRGSPPGITPPATIPPTACARRCELFVLHFPGLPHLSHRGADRPPDDRAIIDAAIAKARADWFGPDAGIFDFLRDALTLDLDRPGPQRPQHSRACAASRSRCSSSPGR